MSPSVFWYGWEKCLFLFCMDSSSASMWNNVTRFCVLRPFRDQDAAHVPSMLSNSVRSFKFICQYGKIIQFFLSAVEIIFTSGHIPHKKTVVADHPFLFTLAVKDQQLFTGVLTGYPSDSGTRPDFGSPKPWLVFNRKKNESQNSVPSVKDALTQHKSALELNIIFV